MTIRPYKVLLLTCMVNCTMGTPTSRLYSVVQWSVHWAPSWTTRVLVLAKARRCALEMCGKKKCELCFQAWLNLYITSAAGLWVTYIQTYIYLKFLVFKTCPDAFLFASSSIFFCTLARVGYFLYQMNKKNKINKLLLVK